MNKILVLTNNASGLFSFRAEVIKSFLDKGYSVTLAMPYDELVGDFKAMGCKYINIPVDRRGVNPIKDLFLFFNYLKTIKLVKPNVVLTYTIKPNVYGGVAAAICKVPCLANITGLGTAVETPGLLQKLTLFMYRNGLKKDACVFFQNQFNMDFCLQHGISGIRNVLLPGSGVNLKKFENISFPSEDTTEFIFISRIMRQKGIQEYLYVAEKLTLRYGNKVKFHVLGRCEDTHYEQVMRMAQDKGWVTWHGEQKDVRPFIAKVHCIIHPSFYPEGMSNVILECAASGRAAITTKRPGCKETVVDGVTGYLVDEQNKEQVLEAAMKFIELPFSEKQIMGLNARKYMESHFDRNIVINAYHKVIDSLTSIAR